VIAWAGVRGAVSLAAALALPIDVPQRDVIVFVTFVVILVSLIGPVVTLPGLVRLIGIEDDGGADREDAKARIKAAEAALARIEEIAEEGWANEDSLQRARGQYRFRTNRFTARLTGEDGDGAEERSVLYQRLRRELLDAERMAVNALRNQGVITQEVAQRVQRDIDLEDSRLDT
jgi:CPA1 family monovalent cation:H+ antiporter